MKPGKPLLHTRPFSPLSQPTLLAITDSFQSWVVVVHSVTVAVGESHRLSLPKPYKTSTTPPIHFLYDLDQTPPVDRRIFVPATSPTQLALSDSSQYLTKLNIPLATPRSWYETFLTSRTKIYADNLLSLSLLAMSPSPTRAM